MDNTIQKMQELLIQMREDNAKQARMIQEMEQELDRLRVWRAIVELDDILYVPDDVDETNYDPFCGCDMFDFEEIY